MNILKLSKYSIVLLSLAGIYISVFPGKTVRVVLESINFAIIGILFINYSNVFKNIFLDKIKYLKFFFFYSFIVFMHGCFVAESYEQWRILFTGYLPILLLPWLSILASVPDAFFIFMKTIFGFAIPLSFIYFAMGQMTSNENLAYVFFVSFLFLIILLIPYVKLKWKIIIISLSFLSLTFNTDNRSFVINIIISYLILLLIPIARLLVKNTFTRIIKVIRIFFLIVPFILLILGYTGILNVFEYFETSQSVNVYVISENEKNLSVDSRTSIYRDAINSVSSVYDVVFGISPTKYYKTSLAEDFIEGGYDKGRLEGAEAGILNLFQWGGIIYVNIILLLFYYCSNYAIFYSKNLFSKLLGVWLSFQWFNLFIENPVGVKFGWITIFIVFGVCLNPNFRNLSDKDINILFSKL